MNYDNIPKELKQIPQWVVWKVEPNNKTPQKPKKVPKQVNGDYAKVNDPSTFATYDAVVQASKSGNFDGIGFVFTEQDCYVGIDLDNVVHDHTLHPVAKQIIEALDTYTEYSPSKTGVHIIARGQIPAGKKTALSDIVGADIEMYNKGRYFTFTGDAIRKTAVQARVKEINNLYKRYSEKSKTDVAVQSKSVSSDLDLSDSDLLDKAYSSRNGSSIKALYQGDYSNYQSQSEADQALCNHLAFWTNKDAHRMDSIFRSSGLYRPKWDTKHSSDGTTYGQMTIQTAIDGCRDGYQPRLKKSDISQKKPSKILKMADVESTRTEWLCKPYLPLGKVTILVADPGTGKTFLALKICALVSNGSYILDDENHMFFGQMIKPSIALYQTAEDGIADTIKPRLETMDANMDNIIFIDDRDRPISFDDNINEIESVLSKHRPKIAIFDPVQAFIGSKVDMNRPNQVRAALTRVMGLADKYNCAVVLIAHRNKMATSKNSKTDDLYRVLGSIDFIGAARSVLTLVRDPENDDGIALLHTKSNLAAKGDVVLMHIDTNNGGVVFDGFRDKDDDTYNTLAGTKKSPKLDQAREFLNEFLSDGDKYREDIIKELHDAGLNISSYTLNLARQQLGIYAYREKKKQGKTIWSFKPSPQVVGDE